MIEVTSGFTLCVNQTGCAFSLPVHEDSEQLTIRLNEKVSDGLGRRLKVRKRMHQWLKMGELWQTRATIGGLVIVFCSSSFGEVGV